MTREKRNNLEYNSQEEGAIKLAYFTLVLGEKLALAILLAEAASISSMPDNGGQLLDEYQSNLSANIAMWVERLRDGATYKQLKEKIVSDSEHWSRLEAISKNPTAIHGLVDENLVGNLGNESLRIVGASELKAGDYALVPSMKFAVGMLYLSIAQNRYRDSIKDWVKAARAFYRQCEEDESGAILKQAGDHLNAAQKDGDGFGLARRSQLRIIERMFNEQGFAPDELGPMLVSGELIFSQISG